MDIVLKSQVSALLFDDLYSRFTRVMDRYGYHRMQSAVIQNSGVKQRIKSQFLTLYQQMTTMNSMPNKYGFPMVVKSLLSLCEDFRLHYLPLPVTHRSAHSSSLCFHQVTFRQLFSQEILGCLSDVIAVLKLLIELGFAPQRLSAAGYGEFYPISIGETQRDFQQNRRIELKLTSR